MNSQSHQQHKHQTSQTNSPSLYDILGVPLNATIQEITKMFRRRAVKEHPDKGEDPEKFRTLSEAYEILKNPEKKDLYDKYGIEGVKAGGDPNSNGFFNLFQTHSKGPKKCRPKLVQVKITLQEAFVGKETQREAIRIRACKECLGKGGQNAVNCQPCQGRGMKELIVMIAPGIPTRRPVPCEDCQGMGITFSQQDKCKICDGKRVVEDTKMFKIIIQPGVPHQHDYIIPSQADQIPGFQAGDLYFRIFIEPHQIFTRKGADLYFTKQIFLLHALSGVTFTQKLLNQQQILISSIQKEIISSNQRKLIKRKGMPFYKSPQSRGHLVVTFNVIMPLFENLQQRKYFRLSHLLKQPIKYSRDVQGVVLQLESYKQSSKIRANEMDDEGQGGVQCQAQ